MLRYRMRPAPGLRVQFVEIAGGLRQLIGKPRSGASGATKFSPLVVRSRGHAIEAVMVRGGIPSPGRIVAHFSVRAPGRPGTIRKLQVKRARGVLTIRFAAAANATSYLIQITDAAGRTFRAVTARRRLRVSAVPAGRLIVRVSALGALARTGPTLTRLIS